MYSEHFPVQEFQFLIRYYKYPADTDRKIPQMGFNSSLGIINPIISSHLPLVLSFQFLIRYYKSGDKLIIDTSFGKFQFLIRYYKC